MASRLLGRLSVGGRGVLKAGSWPRLSAVTSAVSGRRAFSGLCGPVAKQVNWSGSGWQERPIQSVVTSGGGAVRVPCRGYHQTELEEEFEQKVEELREMDRGQLTVTMNRHIDAYYNQAVRGPCTEDGAMIGAGSSDTLREAMLEMWGSLEDMETDVAMAHFIELVNEAQSFPGSIEAKEQRDMELYEQEQMAFEVYGKEDLVVTVKDHVQTIRFNRPTRRNALTLQMYNDIVEALAQAAVNDDIYLTVFTGSGEYYCSGNDLSNFDLANTSLSELVKVARSTLERFVAAFIDHPKPLVAAVNGPAIGIAVTTLALCDLVLASSDATFNTPFTSLGQSPEGCSSYLFPRIMGPAKANDVLLLGYKLTAEAALQYRLASRVMPASAFQRDYRSVLHWMTSLPQQSLQSSRSLIRSYDIDKLHQVNRLECDLLEKCWASQECHQALLEFSQRHKRKLQKRLEMLEGHDSRLVRDREIKLEKELEQHEQAEARLPPPDMAQQLHAGSSNADHAGGLDRITEGHSESSDNPK